ncbi:MAG TPA: hypothetical protein PKD24_04965 [Pyrinomonadaceae bacterium]|nr:hypothetical protein [Pyrinomonadaceae bacterium]HMP64903.1 hypothetical protein [Pyrinomonadaceae bacterium]
MSFKYRFLSVAVINSLLLVGLIFAFSQNGLALSQRLVDLNLQNATDFQTFMIFLGGLVVSLFANIFLLAARRNEYSYDQIRSLALLLRGGR